MSIVAVDAAVLDESAAGQDPKKKRQIMEGARKVLLENGFDGASMNDIARVAGVSKGTLYVYFENKEQLFVELISTEKREELFRVIELDPSDHDVEKVMRTCGIQLMAVLTKPYYIRAMRTVFSILNRMPEIGKEFYNKGPQLCSDRLADYLRVQVSAGILDIEDCSLAAQQFIELTQTGVIRQLLFGIVETPSLEEIERRVDTALRVFMKVYGRA